MVRIYVLDLPEFSPLVQAVRASGIAVQDSGQGYWVVSSESEVVLERKVLNLDWALWYTCLSGGIDGKVAHFDRERIVVRSTEE